MKKTITSVAALFLFAGVSFASKTTGESTNLQNKAAVAAASSVSLSQILEENILLHSKVEKMTMEAEDLQSKLNYSHMMHSTVNNLQKEVLNKANEEAKDQLDFARMMTATLVNLSAELARK